MRRFLVLAALALVSAGCGRVADLQPRPGETLPQKPALASRALTAEELLELPPYADPRRVDELTKRGEVREADRFDLPPPDGESVPLPTGANQPSTPSTTGPDSQEPQSR